MPRRPDLPCSGCGTLLWRGKTSLPEGAVLCNPCRRDKPTYRPSNMAANGYVDQWACEGCGASCERPSMKGTRPKWCASCRPMGGKWMAPAKRLTIYERDAWSCGICHERVDRSLIGSRSIWRPSVDHILPRSAGGTDDLGNLRLAHFWCNAVLADGRSYADEDFRAVAH